MVIWRKFSFRYRYVKTGDRKEKEWERKFFL